MMCEEGEMRKENWLNSSCFQLQ